MLCGILASTSFAHAQMLLVDPGADDPGMLHFNPEFIARNSVKSVSGQAWVKRDGRPMVPLDRHFLYRFGEGGRLGYSNNSFGKPGSGIDTASVMYSYDAMADCCRNCIMTSTDTTHCERSTTRMVAPYTWKMFDWKTSAVIDTASWKEAPRSSVMNATNTPH